MSDEPRGERIAKWLARAGVASRRDAEKLIAEGRVRLNNAVVTHPATFVAKGDLVTVGTTLVDAPERTRLWRYHKPVGLVTTHRDPQGRPTVFERLPTQLPRVVSIGRLDLNSEGLLLLTNDGALARRLELPSTGWLRRYRVRVFGAPSPGALAELARGVTVDGVRYGPIEAGLDSRRGDNAWMTVSLREGRNREVRKVMAHLGLQVGRLIRIAYGPFQLGTLAEREVDEVSGKVLREQLPDEDTAAGARPDRAGSHRASPRATGSARARPDAAQPVGATPDQARPDTAGANAAPPDAARPDAASADRTAPDQARPDTAGANAAPPDAARPDAASADRTAPDQARPDTAGANAAPPDGARPDAASADRTAPDQARPDTAGANAAPPDGAGSDRAGPGARPPESAGTNATRLDAARPDAASADRTAPDRARPDASGANAPLPDGAGPDRARPDETHPVRAGADASLDEAGPHRAGPDRARPDSARPRRNRADRKPQG